MMGPIFASLVLLAALPAAIASSLNVQNNCDFGIQCSAAKNDGSSSPPVEVNGNGGTYSSPLLANDDNVGTVLKCGISGPVFQMELDLQNGRSWLDLSALDGDPFLPYHRHVELAGQCVIDCPATSTTCEWPLQVDCSSSEDGWLTLC
ncbi:uncharacterized protein F4822DRAFT_432651 [Hypoxylon trugodes]|uniref:uncharacterized protein n=1 Tax=Hypoxylon trugodes TaxID=326681 RepID=UPI0021932777|nr:uncharacterized protein F4822DRAFT_432651 [Hypoxylon trugodes]KAI1385793.1 hypothetical protein F4822DRAFT_432651 [Hypoxylon trugodes]